MKTITATNFREQCFAILDAVDDEGLVITKRGVPVARLVRIEPDARQLIGALRGRIRVKGDISATGLNWHTQP